MRVLNLYAGIGGNRKLWDAEVTAVEHDERIAGVYQRLHPKDRVIIGDAHQYLLDHFQEFDFIWSSPPCPTHSKMNQSGRNRTPRYPDMGLYQEIIFLKHNFKGHWAVENVVPYYTPLIEPSVKIGRHLFWSNYRITPCEAPHFKGFIKKQNLQAKRELQDWLGIHFEENIYVGNNHCPTQVLRNCVHPDMGLHVFNESIQREQPDLFAAGNK